MYDRFEILGEIRQWEMKLSRLNKNEDWKEIEEIKSPIEKLKKALDEAE